MGFGDFLREAASAGASALGVDSDDVSGFFDKAKGALDGDAGDFLGKAAQQFGIDSDDLTSAAGSIFGGGGGGGAGGGGGGGGFGGAISEFLGGGDVAGAAQQAIGGFGAILGGGGGDIVKSVSDYLPASVREAFSEAGELPFVQNAATGNWAEMASSVPGLNGAMGSLGISTQDVAQHIEGTVNQAVDGGSAWSFGSMLADRGSEFLSQVAAPTNAEAVMASLPGLAQKAGVELPGWATDLSSNGLTQQGGRFLADGGFVLAQIQEGADIYANADELASTVMTQVQGHVADAGGVTTRPAPAAEDTLGESQVQAASEHSLDEFSTAPANTGVAGPPEVHNDYGTEEVDPNAVVQQAVPEETHVVEEAPPPAEQFDAADQLEQQLDDIGDGMDS